jgi:hypothetical protein
MKATPTTSRSRKHVPSTQQPSIAQQWLTKNNSTHSPNPGWAPAFQHTHRNETMAATNKKMIDYHVMEYVWHDRRNNAQMRDHHMRQAVVVYAYCTRKQFEKLVAKAQQVTA